MKELRRFRNTWRLVSRVGGFTLIELLVVITVIVILAGMVFAAIPAVGKLKAKNRAYAELGQIQTAIAAYKSKLGYYPPDTGMPTTNLLYYELKGTTRVNDPAKGPIYTTLDGSASITETELKTIFNNQITGFMNCTKDANDADSARAQNFLPKLKIDQFRALPFITGQTNFFVLASSALDPLVLLGVNPWRYASANATNNPNSYDLWIDVTLGKTVQRIGNWSTTVN